MLAVTSQLETAGPFISPPPVDGAVAVIGSGSRARLVVEALAGHGWSAELHAAAEEAGAGRVLVFAEIGLPAATRALKALAPNGSRPTAIVVCERARPGEVRMALAGGVAGIVFAADLASTLVPTFAAVLAGQVAVPWREARQVEAASLSTREKQILGLVVMGCPNGEIAERLVVAESTVKSHLSSAFGKLGVRSRNEAVDLILDAERGLGKGILGLGGEPLATGVGAAPLGGRE